MWNAWDAVHNSLLQALNIVQRNKQVGCYTDSQKLQEAIENAIWVLKGGTPRSEMLIKEIEKTIQVFR